MNSFYFDTAATAIPDSQIYEQAMHYACDFFANPSSTHALGKAAKAELEIWRQRAAIAVGANERQVIFTSGATEANQIILLRMLLLKDKERSHIVAPTFEHPSIHENLLTLKNQGIQISWVNPKSSGHIDEGEFVEKIENNTRLATLMLVNNETGAIQPVADLIHEIRLLPFGSLVHVHVDATQALGRIPLNIGKIGCDSASFSAHKIGGPKGAGLLYMKTPKPSIFHGGGQEFHIRAGTENLFGIIGMVLALEKACATDYTCRANEKMWLQTLSELEATFVPKPRNLHPEFYAPSIISCAFPPLPGEVISRLLSEKNLYVGTGSACGNNKKDRLRGLLSMGVSAELAESAIRISWAHALCEEKTHAACQILKDVILEQKAILHF
ncbi:MAG: cysteine desulfurase family protein [Spirochaetia bacterium]